MKLDKLLFAAILLMCAAVGLTAFLPETGASVEHPDYPTMRHSGSSIEHQGVPLERGRLWVGWLFGASVMLFFVTLIGFGARRHIRDLGRWLALVAVAVIGAWTWLTVAYHGYLDDPTPALYLALPAPTAIMVYLFWPLTLCFVLFFVLGFRRWVLSDEDFETYKRLVKANRRRDRSEAGP